jgi:uncharacterized membrane protein
MTISKTDLSLLLSALSVLLALGLGTYVIVAVMAFLVAKAI